MHTGVCTSDPIRRLWQRYQRYQRYPRRCMAMGWIVQRRPNRRRGVARASWDRHRSGAGRSEHVRPAGRWQTSFLLSDETRGCAGTESCTVCVSLSGQLKTDWGLGRVCVGNRGCSHLGVASWHPCRWRQQCSSVAPDGKFYLFRTAQAPEGRPITAANLLVSPSPVVRTKGRLAERNQVGREPKLTLESCRPTVGDAMDLDLTLPGDAVLLAAG